MCVNRQEQHNNTAMSKSKATIGEILGHADASPTASLLHCMAACVTELYYKGHKTHKLLCTFQCRCYCCSPHKPESKPQ